MIYRDQGTYSPEPVILEETVTAVDGLRLAIDVTATRGGQQRRWIQVVTDTEENRENNAVDELIEVVDGERHALDAHDGRELVRLYGWTLPPCGAFEEAPEPEARDITVGSETYACRCVRARTTCEGSPATAVIRECPDFVWGHAYGEVRLDGSEGEPLWSLRAMESGRR